MNSKALNNQDYLLVIVTHYNNSSTLVRCLDSIFKYFSNCQKIKFLLIDDNSDKFHFSRLLEISKSYNIELIRSNTNVGIASARNMGINFGITHHYNYLTFIDSDDHLINSIRPENYLNNDITLFNSLETIDNYEYTCNYKSFVVKNNFFQTDNLEKLLKEYIIKPNKVPTLTTCWAKIYKIEIIKKNNIFFNQKMKTFEDVDFLFRYLMFAINIKFNAISVYAHTNNGNLTSLTFSKDAHKNNLFSFLQASRSLRNLIFRNYQSLNFNIKHFCACYYSISLIRISINNDLKSKYHLFLFINRRLRSRFFINCFKNYDVETAGGSPKIKEYILSKSPLRLLFFLIKTAKVRYG